MKVQGSNLDNWSKELENSLASLIQPGDESLQAALTWFGQEKREDWRIWKVTAQGDV